MSEAVTGEYHIQVHGANMDVLLQSPREYELSAHMHPSDADSAENNTNMVLSPMPGTLVSYAVSPEEQVVEGQELCVVEAMKMQNIIRSPRKGTIKSLTVDVGSSLLADQLLLEFEDESSSSSEDEAA
uniref:Lipoyl-binding domain-containing protein n=1 Tax=Grammatophora oceanica TaxID=210454 RepID=A0A7S1V326_9STRA